MSDFSPIPIFSIFCIVTSVYNVGMLYIYSFNKMASIVNVDFSFFNMLYQSKCCILTTIDLLKYNNKYTVLTKNKTNDEDKDVSSWNIDNN